MQRDGPSLGLPGVRHAFLPLVGEDYCVTSQKGLLNLKVLQLTAKIEISITLPSTNFCISHLKGKNIQYLTFPYTKYKNLCYFHITYVYNCYF